MGRQLAAEAPVEADLVIPVPDTGIPAAIGYAEASGIPYAEGLIKNRYVYRTFIQPDERPAPARRPHEAEPAHRGDQGQAPGRRRRLDRARQHHRPSSSTCCMSAGAREVHLRISSPPIRYPCFYGIDMATRAELIAANKSDERDPPARRRHHACTT